MDGWLPADLDQKIVKGKGGQSCSYKQPLWISWLIPQDFFLVEPILVKLPIFTWQPCLKRTPEGYPQSSQTSKMKLFAKIVDSFHPLIFLAESSIIDVWMSPDWASGLYHAYFLETLRKFENRSFSSHWRLAGSIQFGASKNYFKRKFCASISWSKSKPKVLYEIIIDQMALKSLQHNY